MKKSKKTRLKAYPYKNMQKVPDPEIWPPTHFLKSGKKSKKRGDFQR